MNEIPHNIEAEQSVLGGLLIDNSAIDKINFLKADHFYSAQNRKIFATMVYMLNRGHPVDIVTVTEELGDEAEQFGGIQYLGHLAQHTPSSANIKRYAELVIERARTRDLFAVANRIWELAKEQGDVDAKINTAQSIVMGLNETNGRNEPRSLLEILPDAIDTIDERTQKKLEGVLTGIVALDTKLNGLKNGELIIIAARPGMGKSVLGLQIALEVSHTQTALMLSQEMSYQQIADRLIARKSKLGMSAVSSGVIEKDEWPNMTAAFGMLKDLPLYLDEQGSLTLADVCAKARKLKRKHGLGILVVDYIQLMTGDGDNRNNEIEKISRGLKSLAKELKIPVIALSQLSRQVDNRVNKRPVLSDLRDSGAIEQDADVVIFIYREDVYDKNSPDAGTAEIIIGKNRQGVTGPVRTAFDGELSQFSNLAFEWKPKEVETTTRRKVGEY